MAKDARAKRKLSGYTDQSEDELDVSFSDEDDNVDNEEEEEEEQIDELMDDDEEQESDGSPNKKRKRNSSQDDDYGTESSSQSDDSHEHKASKVVVNLQDQQDAQLRQAKCLINQRRIFDFIVSLRIQMQQVISAYQSSRLQSAEQSGLTILFDDNSKRKECWEKLMEILSKFQSIHRKLLENSSVPARLLENAFPNDETEQLFNYNILQESRQSLESWKWKEMEKWHENSLMLTGGAIQQSKQKSQFLKPQASTVRDQIELILKDRERMVRKNTVKLEINKRETTSDQSLRVADDEDKADILASLGTRVFDDSDFYQQLLRQVIESAELDHANVNLSANPGANHAILLRKTRKRNMKEVDRRASKGRKLRYVVHPKLVGFLEPIPDTEPPPALDELVAGLFGAQRKLTHVS